jgi:hypothetical protein
MENKKPVDIEHTPRPAARALMTTTAINKERQAAGIEYTEGVEYIDDTPKFGDMVEPYSVKISRVTSELSGAFPFLFNTISYVLTNEVVKKAFYTEIDKGYYDSIVLPLDVFMDITLDKTKGVRPFLMSELAKLEKNKPSKIIPFDENVSVYGQPIILTIGREKAGHIEHINRDRLDTKLTKVQILFMKCFFRNTNGYIQEPKAVYAKLIAANIERIRREELAIATRQETLADLATGAVKLSATAELKLTDDTDHILYTETSAINRVREFLYLYDNGKDREINYTDKINELFTYFQPQYIRETGKQKGQFRGKKEAMEALNRALSTIQIMYENETHGRRIIGFDIKDGKNPPRLKVTFDGTNNGKKILKRNNLKN